MKKLNKQPAALSRNYKWELLGLLCLAFFFHQGDRAIYGVVLPQIRAELQLTDAQLGFVGTVLFFTLAILMPFAGYLGDMLRKKWVITGAILFWSSSTMFTGLSRGVVSLTMLRSVATAGGESFYAPAAYALLAKFHRATRAIAMSIHQGALYFGVMVSGFLGGYIAEQWGWRATFYVYGIAGILLGFIFIFRLKDDEDHHAGETPLDAPEAAEAPAPPTPRQWQNPLKMLGILFRKPTALLLTVGFTAIVFVNNAYVVWAPEYLHEKFDLSLTQAGGYSMFYHHITALIGVLIGGTLSDAWVKKYPRARMTMQTVAMLLGAPAIVYMGLAHSPMMVYLAMAVFGMFRGLYESNTHASLFDVIEPEYRASAVGVMVMLAFLVGSLSPWLMGYMREVIEPGKGLSYAFAGYGLAYVIGGLAVGLGLLVFFKNDRIVEDLTESQ
ncbi:MFS transporter [Planctomycetales bacterium ZRK34]|nr:MFS transporter [Planctomycetales bacterium ZRK34]